MYSACQKGQLHNHRAQLLGGKIDGEQRMDKEITMGLNPFWIRILHFSAIPPDALSRDTVQWNTKKIFQTFDNIFLFTWSHNYFFSKIGQQIQPIQEQIFARSSSAPKKPSWELNFLHIFGISSSSRHEKHCQMLQRLFCGFHYSRNSPWHSVVVVTTESQYIGFWIGGPLKDHPFKTSAFFRGEGSKICQICQRIVLKNCWR